MKFRARGMDFSVDGSIYGNKYKTQPAIFSKLKAVKSKPANFGHFLNNQRMVKKWAAVRISKKA